MRRTAQKKRASTRAAANFGAFPARFGRVPECCEAEAPARQRRRGAPGLARAHARVSRRLRGGVGAAALRAMSAVEPPSLGRYLLGCVIMLLAVVAPLALAWLRTTSRGLSYTRGLGCVSLDACSHAASSRVGCHLHCLLLLRHPQPLR